MEAMTDDTRTRVLNAAGPIFAEKGFQATTVREICQAADVNLASVNYHFGDKERLYIAAVKQARELRMAQVPFPERPRGTPGDVLLRDFILTMLRRMLGVDELPWQSRLMMREILSPTEACRQMVEEHFRPEFDRLMEILDQLLPPETPKHTRQQIGFSVVGQCLFYRVANNIVSLMITPAERQYFSIDSLSDHITQLTLAALGRVPSFAATTELTSSEYSQTG
jgi:AcrR family transcriptional regulator